MSEGLLLEAEGLVHHYRGPTRGSRVHAVDEVSLRLHRGEVVALVGESGCGKSTLGRVLVRLLEPEAGTLRFHGEDITHSPMGALKPLRRHMQIVFQDPKSALSPRRTVEELLAEPFIIHGLAEKAEIAQRVRGLLDAVGLAPDILPRHPHALSGGQRQRVNIARALALEPELLVLDEPTSAVDVSVQAQVLNLLAKLREERALTYLIIAHDLDVVAHLADRVLVMYLGRIVEEGPVARVFGEPAHPYTRALLAASPGSDVDESWRPRPGEPPSPLEPPSGCRFHPRCPRAEARCSDAQPELIELGGGQQRQEHRAACVLVESEQASG